MPDPGYGASASRGVPAYALAFTVTHCAYSRRDGQAELTWVTGSLRTEIINLSAISYPS